MRIEQVLGGVALGLLVAGSSGAEIEGWNGVLHASVPDITNASLVDCVSSDRLQESWEIKPFLAGSDGSYVISVTEAAGMPQEPDDALMALYETNFTGTWGVNCLAVNDDGVDFLPQITFNLAAGNRYVVLVTYAAQPGVPGAGDNATYAATIDGPGAVHLSIFEDGFETGGMDAWTLPGT